MQCSKNGIARHDVQARGGIDVTDVGAFTECSCLQFFNINCTQKFTKVTLTVHWSDLSVIYSFVKRACMISKFTLYWDLFKHWRYLMCTTVQHINISKCFLHRTIERC